MQHKSQNSIKSLQRGHLQRIINLFTINAKDSQYKRLAF